MTGWNTGPAGPPPEPDNTSDEQPKEIFFKKDLPTVLDNIQSSQPTIDSEVGRILKHYKEYVTGVYQGVADYDEATAAHSLTNLIAQEAKAFGGCRNCFGKGYATVRKGTTAKGKTWDLRTHINYCSCDRGKQLQQVLAQEANKARLETMQKVSDQLDDLHQGTEGAGWVHYGEMGEWLDDEISRLTVDKEQAALQNKTNDGGTNGASE